jgi:hypothetical protein
VVILSSNGYFGNGHPIHNEINRSEIELLKADNAKLWKELEKMTEKVQTLTNSAIFQLCHGENKLIFNEMMMRSALY